DRGRDRRGELPQADCRGPGPAEPVRGGRRGVEIHLDARMFGAEREYGGRVRKAAEASGRINYSRLQRNSESGSGTAVRAGFVDTSVHEKPGAQPIPARLSRPQAAAWNPARAGTKAEAEAGPPR